MREVATIIHVKHGYARVGKLTKEYKIWMSMLSRCLNHPDYAGRGIAVCERWKEFPNFLADMGKCPPGYSIERKDNNGNYEPTNCKWATKREQASNRRSNILIELNGEKRTLTYWAVHFGVNRGTVSTRFHSGCPIEKLFEPSRRTR